MSNFTLSAFADEIDPSLDVQIQALSERNIGYVELRGIDGKNISTFDMAEIKEVKRKLVAGAIKVSAIGSPVGKIKITDDFAPNLELLQKMLQFASVLETKYVRIFSFYIPQEEAAAKYRDEVLRRMDAFANAAKHSDVVLLHENESHIYGDSAERCLDILRSVGSDRLRATFDPANFVICNEIVYPIAFEMLRPYIEYLHIKDALPTGDIVPSGLGIGSVRDVLSSLQKSGWSGFAALEPHLANFAGLAGLEQTARYGNSAYGGGEKFDIALGALQRILGDI